jgi:hypothetical protein
MDNARKEREVISSRFRLLVNPTLVESKNVENKNESVGGDLSVRVRARKVSPVFSAFLLSSKVG